MQKTWLTIPKHYWHTKTIKFFECIDMIRTLNVCFLNSARSIEPHGVFDHPQRWKIKEIFEQVQVHFRVHTWNADVDRKITNVPRDNKWIPSPDLF